MHYFSMYDSFSDSICYFEEDRSYSVNAGNATIIQGGNFTYSEDFRFKLTECYSNENCDNKDLSVHNECLLVTSACLHKFKECAEYGQILFVSITVSSVLKNPYFKIIDENDVLKLKGRLFILRNFTCQLKVCSFT